jgi:hypothetical protein
MCYSEEIRVENEIESRKCKYGKVLAVIPLTAVLFSQGVNEMQTLANYHFLGENNDLQHSINEENMSRLRDYFENYESVALAQAKKTQDLPLMRKVKKEILSIKEQIADTSASVQQLRNNDKNVSILLDTSSLCHALSGIHSICCKSGKDRTGVSSTLEQAIHLSNHCHVPNGKNICHMLRLHGCRRLNIFANTKQFNYAFNLFQLKILPKCYQPPSSTISGKVQT